MSCRVSSQIPFCLHASQPLFTGRKVSATHKFANETGRDVAASAILEICHLKSFRATPWFVLLWQSVLCALKFYTENALVGEKGPLKSQTRVWNSPLILSLLTSWRMTRCAFIVDLQRRHLKINLFASHPLLELIIVQYLYEACCVTNYKVWHTG